MVEKGGILVKKGWYIAIAALSAVFVGLVVFAIWGLPEASEPPIDPVDEASRRAYFVAEAEKWLGCKESNGSHKPIIDIYNTHKPLPIGYEVKYTDEWCATFVSAVAIQCEMTDIIPKECGCQRQIDLFKGLGRWEENDDYIPKPGDIIYYSSEGKNTKNNIGWSNHVGIVVKVEGDTIQTIEGNYSDRVRYREIKIGYNQIRGYGLPDYAKERP